MIQIIGVMIAAYVITRMVELMTNKQTHDTVALCAFVTLLISVFGVYMLFTTGNQLASILSH
jgi:hypothetical protein